MQWSYFLKYSVKRKRLCPVKEVTPLIVLEWRLRTTCTPLRPINKTPIRITRLSWRGTRVTWLWSTPKKSRQTMAKTITQQNKRWITKIKKTGRAFPKFSHNLLRITARRYHLLQPRMFGRVGTSWMRACIRRQWASNAKSKSLTSRRSWRNRKPWWPQVWAPTTCSMTLMSSKISLRESHTWKTVSLRIKDKAC